MITRGGFQISARIRRGAVIGALVALSACGGETALIEEARFALDGCNPAKQAIQSVVDACNLALTKANEVLATDPTNTDAAAIASSAHVGLAGFDFLQFISTLVDSESNSSSTDQFKQFQDKIKSVEALNGVEISLAEMQKAIDILTTVLTQVTADNTNLKAFFQLGALQAIDGFVRPAKLITFDANNNLDASGITTDQFNLVDKSARGSDDNLTTAGITDTDTLKASREAYCRCTVNAKAVGGWTEACLRDVMRCNLSENANETLEQNYDGNAAGTRAADCDALNAKSTDLTKCKETNT